MVPSEQRVVSRPRRIETPLSATARRALLVLYLTTALTGAVSGVRAQRPTAERLAQPIWSGTSAGYAIAWTAGDLTLRPAAQAGSVGFSALQFARRDFALIEKEGNFNCEYERTFKLLSVVGSIVSYEDDYGLSCEEQAHPYGRARFVAIDLARPSAPRRDLARYNSIPNQYVSLTDYFPPGEILEALLADALVHKALDGQSPRTLPALLAYLEEKKPTVGGENEKQCFELDSDLLTRFAFQQIEGNKVAVRLGLSGWEICRHDLTQIGLLLSIPESLKGSLAAAGAGTEGFLMNRKIGAGRETMIRFDKRKRPRH